MPPQIRPYAVFRSKKDFDKCVAEIVAEYVSNIMKPERKDAFNQGLDAGTAYGIDMSILALGRLLGDALGQEHTCKTCANYRVSCVPSPKNDLGECKKHKSHGDWSPKKISIDGPEFYTDFMKKVAECASDYGELFDIDVEENNDKDLWWSSSKLDDELFKYISPDVYPPFEERYKPRKKVEEEVVEEEKEMVEDEVKEEIGSESETEEEKQEDPVEEAETAETEKIEEKGEAENG